MRKRLTRIKVGYSGKVEEFDVDTFEESDDSIADTSNGRTILRKNVIRKVATCKDSKRSTRVYFRRK